MSLALFCLRNTLERLFKLKPELIFEVCPPVVSEIELRDILDFGLVLDLIEGEWVSILSFYWGVYLLWLANLLLVCVFVQDLVLLEIIEFRVEVFGVG